MIRICISLLFVLVIGAGKINAQTKTVEIKTQIYCSHCTQCETCGQRFDTELYKLKGVKNYTISGNVIKVSYNPNKINVDQIRTCISNCGYDADDVKATEAGINSLDDCCRKQE